ncbi:MAG: LysM peptidoglycan-binding domain-containing protein [Chloroflexi bacterium]|nr:LysM peptidoglycan-binding domain-containing protein [Chloroflexota bacterium]
MQKCTNWTICFALLFLTFELLRSEEVFARPLAQTQPPTPSEVINAVNGLRLARGLPPLSVHPILMQVAQSQADVIAGTEGAAGHERPDGVTLGQLLIMLGYPLSGDLSMDGYRSENWVAADTAEEAVNIWLSDEPHTNTMLSEFRSDIGAGVAVSDQVYIVIDTALQTNSGQPQSDAYPILTGIPLTRTAYAAEATQFAVGGMQYVVPVFRNTAYPNGDVFHEVKYGQTLWSIAVTYGTTIKNLRAWNHLGENSTIYERQLLLVQKGATQPAPVTGTPDLSPAPPSAKTLTSLAVVPGFPTMTIPPSRTPLPVSESSPASFSLIMGLLVVTVTIGGFVAAFSIRAPE